MNLPAIRAQWEKMLVGQPAVIENVMPFLETYHAGLSPEGRPVGVFLLAGQTGTGKTWAVQSLAKCLHGSKENVLRIDCGEYQSYHEVAKLIGAPPGYLGHRETVARLDKNQVMAVASERCGISIILFDEIEKADEALHRILLGVMDSAKMITGCNQVVRFDRCLIFMTSNLGARAIEKLSSGGGFGFAEKGEAKEMSAAAMPEIKSCLSPEFRNRIDRLMLLAPLTPCVVAGILDREVEAIKELMRCRLDLRCPKLVITAAAREAIVKEGFSRTLGARPLKRVLFERIILPVSQKVNQGELESVNTVTIDFNGSFATINQKGACA